MAIAAPLALFVRSGIHPRLTEDQLGVHHGGIPYQRPSGEEFVPADHKHKMLELPSSTEKKIKIVGNEIILSWDDWNDVIRADDHLAGWAHRDQICPDINKLIAKKVEAKEKSMKEAAILTPLSEKDKK